MQIGVFPPHMPRQQGQMAVHQPMNEYKPYPPVPFVQVPFITLHYIL